MCDDQFLFHSFLAFQLRKVHMIIESSYQNLDDGTNYCDLRIQYQKSVEEVKVVIANIMGSFKRFDEPRQQSD